MSSGRDARTNDALALLLWVSRRRLPFSKVDVAAVLRCDPRTALRWIHALARVGAVEVAGRHARGSELFTWRRRDECFRNMVPGGAAALPAATEGSRDA